MLQFKQIFLQEWPGSFSIAEMLVLTPPLLRQDLSGQTADLTGSHEKTKCENNIQQSVFLIRN